MPLKVTAEWLAQTDNRDRLCKTIQFLALLLKNFFETRKNSKQLTEKFLTLFKQMRIARQFFRLFKSFEEYKTIRSFLQKPYHDEFDRMTSIFQYFFYGSYWFFDNFVVLCSCKLITWQTKPIFKVAQYCKFLAILENLLISSRNLLRLHHWEIKLRLTMLETHTERENQDSIHKIIEIKEKKLNLWIHLVKLGCDLVSAIEWSDFLYKWTGFRVPEPWVSVSGLLSALITVYYGRLERDYWENSLKNIH